MCCDTVNRGVAHADDTIFLHRTDTTVVALAAMTGEVKWSVQNGDPSAGQTNTATVLPVKDMVIVGILWCGHRRAALARLLHGA